MKPIQVSNVPWLDTLIALWQIHKDEPEYCQWVIWELGQEIIALDAEIPPEPTNPLHELQVQRYRELNAKIEVYIPEWRDAFPAKYHIPCWLCKDVAEARYFWMRVWLDRFVQGKIWDLPPFPLDNEASLLTAQTIGGL